MKKARHVVSCLLIVALTVTGIPLLYQQGANRHGTVDLSEAILRVGGLAEQAMDSGSMHFQMAHALTALRVAAELETVIAADDSAEASILSARIVLYLPTGASEQAQQPSLERPVSFSPSLYSSIPPDRVERPPRA